jgi:hypothetical protein
VKGLGSRAGQCSWEGREAGHVEGPGRQNRAPVKGQGGGAGLLRRSREAAQGFWEGQVRLCRASGKDQGCWAGLLRKARETGQGS